MPTQIDLDHYNQIPLPVFIIKKDRKDLLFLTGNALFQKEMGKTDGLLFDDLFPHAAQTARALKGPKPPETALLTIGNQTYQTTISLINYDGQDAYLCVMSDVTTLQNAIISADNLATQKSNLLATISHEIRTPMQSVYGMIELIEQSDPPSDIEQMADIAKNSAGDLLEILDDVLDFAKVDAGQMPLDHFEVPIRTLVRGIIEALSVKIQGKSITIEDDISDDVPPVVIGDPKRLRQIIMNLVGNALKFTHEGSVNIRVCCDVEHISPPKTGIGLRFEISDTGIGMGQSTIDKLFKPFTQADSSTTREYGGTGLGLSICYKLTHLMGGQIGVESEAGKGTTFWFEIPTEAVDVDADTLEMPDLKGISILSVEDHPLGAKEIARALTSIGATVESCGTVSDALTLIKRRRFDIALIDQGLPDGTGLDLIRDIMGLRPFMGLIMYTVHENAALRHSLQSLGVTFLAKPASRLGLAEAILTATQNKKRKSVCDKTSSRVLIAEDTASVRDVLKRQLGHLGVDACFAKNGEEALAQLKENDFGLLITDLHMPKMDGYGVIQTIREREKKSGAHLPVIVLTADVHMTDRTYYMSHGFDEALLKPVSLGHIRQLLIRWDILTQDQSPHTNTDNRNSCANKEKDENDLPPALDEESLVAQMGGINKDTIEMLELFIDMTAPLIKNIAQEKNIKTLAEHAHSLKGAARSAGANLLGDLADELQTQAESEENTDFTSRVTDITNEFIRVKHAVKALKTTK